MTSILVLYADPDDPIRLRVDEEIRDIQQTLITSPDRDRFLIEMKAVRRASDLLWALSSNPQIVYFSGHSTASGDLVSETGTSEIRMSGEALAKLFEAARPQVQCVVFNFAHSQALARAVAEHVPNVIAMRAEMSDTAAVEFTRGFFGALAAGRPIRESFDIGCATLRLRGLTSQNPENPSERNEPMLFTGMADPSR